MASAKLTSEVLSEVQVRPVERSEDERYQEQMARHHYLGALPKAGKDLTADALLTQRALATYLVEQQARYHFITVKGNQPTLENKFTVPRVWPALGLGWHSRVG